MVTLKDLLNLESCRVMFSGDPKRIFLIYARRWFDGKKVVANSLPFELPLDNTSIILGNPLTEEGDAYLVTNPLRMGDDLYRWLSGVDRLVVLYEERYVGASIRRLKLRKYLDYLVAYRRETVDRETITLYTLESGKIADSKTFVRLHR
ncbi:MAG: hypothetical protein GXO14_00925 [Thermococci archaeon]|nr:hypothetical protein [Thermococci archaeon]